MVVQIGWGQQNRADFWQTRFWEMLAPIAVFPLSYPWTPLKRVTLLYGIFGFGELRFAVPNRISYPDHSIIHK